MRLLISSSTDHDPFGAWYLLSLGALGLGLGFGWGFGLELEQPHIHRERETYPHSGNCSYGIFHLGK